MANSTAEIPSVEEVIASAARASDVSTIVSEALERRSSNSSAAAFSPFIVADVREVNDIPEVTMTQSVYASLHAADIPTPPVTPLPTVDVSTLDTSAPLPESTESSVDEPIISISHRPLDISTEPVENNTSDSTGGTSTSDGSSETESDNDADESEHSEDDVNSEHSDADDAESEHSDEVSDAEEGDGKNSIHSQEDGHTPKAQPQALEAQIPTEIMFLLFVVLLLNTFNFLMTLTGARQCLRPT